MNLSTPSPTDPRPLSGRLRRWLIDPPDSVHGDQRQHLQLLAWLQTALIPLMSLLGFWLLPALTSPGTPLTDSIIFWVALVSVSSMSLSYALGRMGRYHIASLLAILTGSFGPWLASAPDHHITSFMLIATLLAGTLMSGQVVILIGLLNILLTLLLPMIASNPTLGMSDVFEIVAFHGLLTTLIYIATLHRDSLEARRREQIQAVQLRLEHLMTASQTMIYSLDPAEKNLLTFISQNTSTLLGYSPQEWLTQRTFWSDRLHPDDKEHALNGLIIVGESGRFTTEYRLRLADGSYRWLRDDMALLRDAHGQPLEIVGSMIDISERKQSEHFLRESEARLRGILNATEDRVFLIRPDGTILDYNEAAAEAYGEKLQTFNIYDTAPPDISARRRQHADQVVATNQPERYEDIFNGRHSDVGLYPVLDEEGKVSSVVVMSRDITERRQMQIALQDREERLRLILDQLPGMLWTTDANLIATSSRGAGLADLGLQPDQIVGVSVQAFSGTSDPNAPAIAAHHAALKGVSSQYSDSVAGRHYEVKVEPLRDIDGKVQGVLGISFDVSERKRAEAALRESEERFSKAFHSNPTAMGIRRISDDVLIDFNESFVKLMGIPREQFLSRKVGEMGFYLNPAERQRILEVAARDEPLPSTEMSFKRPDGTIFHVLMSTEPITLGGEPCALADFFDITERKQAEDALRDSQHNLLQAQRIAHLGNWDWNIQKNTLAWSDEIYRIFGIEPQQFEANYEAFLSYVHPDDRQLVDQGVSDALLGKKPYSLDHRVMRPDGTERIVHEQAELTLDAEGKPLRMIGTVQDVTEQKKLENDLREHAHLLEEANAELERLGVLKDDFVANVSHELRTPIANLQLRERLLAKNPERLSTHLPVMSRDTTRLARTIESLLQLSRFDRQKFDLEIRETDLNKLAGQYTTDLAALAQEKGISLTFTPAPGLPETPVDPAMITQVLSILLDNALSYTPAGGLVKIETGFDAKRAGRELFFRVSDSGPGIPAQERSSIFERFFRGTSSVDARVPGTGLGLAIAHEIVIRHQGLIEVGSGHPPTSGAMFTVYLSLDLALNQPNNLADQALSY